MVLPSLPPRDAYDVTIRRMNYPVSQTLRKILELSMTPEEAQLLVELPPSPSVSSGTAGVTTALTGTVEAVAKKLNRDAKTVEAQLENMFQIGLVREIPTPDGKRQYTRMDLIENLSDSMAHVIGARFLDHGEGELHKHTIRDDRWETVENLWTKFFYEEWYRWERPHELVHRKVAIAGGAEAGRTFSITTCWKALEKSERLGTEVLPAWDLREMARKGEAKGIAAGACTCRTRARHCDRPVWVCGALIVGEESGIASWYVNDRRNLRKKFSGEEWLEDIGRFEEELGMVHLGGPGRKGCTCCNDCCNWLEPLQLYTEPWEGVHPTPYRAVGNTDVCEGCVKNCVPRCQFRAIKGQTDPSSGKVKAVVDLEKCIGCGQCVIGCPVEGAIKLDLAEKIKAPLSPIRARLKMPDKAIRRGNPFLAGKLPVSTDIADALR
ncbi:MAG: 4Fe-4S binding protein [Chloroflexi bacterium]|nr:4Fe-4S binding protein [Chloroflexota bacterium]